jgi:hypothetical protein
MSFGGLVSGAPQNTASQSMYTSAKEAPDYILSHPFVQSLQVDLRRATNQVIQESQFHASQYQLIQENARLKGEIQGLETRVQDLHAEVYTLQV